MEANMESLTQAIQAMAQECNENQSPTNVFPNERSWTMRPLDDASFEAEVSVPEFSRLKAQPAMVVLVRQSMCQVSKGRRYIHQGRIVQDT